MALKLFFEKVSFHSYGDSCMNSLGGCRVSYKRHIHLKGLLLYVDTYGYLNFQATGSNMRKLLRKLEENVEFEA